MKRDPLAQPEPLIRRVYAYVAYRIGTGPDADDVTAEAMARALQYRDSYDPSKGEPHSWAIGIAPDPPDLPAPEDMEQDTVDRLTMRAAVLELPERDRELLALRYGADLTARQIGDVLGMTTNAAEVALHRALKRLREVLAEQQADPRART